MRGKNFLISAIFWFHLPFVIVWFGLFLIPLSVFSQRIIFHFWYLGLLFIIQILWGVMLYPKIGKVDFICPLTTILQSLRGYKIKDKKNYGHSFIAELFEKWRIKMSFRAVNILLWITFAIVILQYFFYS